MTRSTRSQGTPSGVPRTPRRNIVAHWPPVTGAGAVDRCASGQARWSADSIAAADIVTVFTVTVFAGIVYSMSDPAVDPVATSDLELTIDDLAQRAGLPVRTIREYQTMGILPAPERKGRVGIYRMSHLSRLELIGRLQRRGYSLAGIRDLLASWRDGADLGEVLGLLPDELVHIDEPGTPATLDQLTQLLPELVPDRLDGLVGTGVVEACGSDSYCIPSPSLLQLAVDLLAAGYDADQTLGLLGTIGQAAGTVADATIALLTDRPEGIETDRLMVLVGRGRGLLAHGTGRLTIHTIGRRLDDTADGASVEMLQRIVTGAGSTNRVVDHRSRHQGSTAS